MAQSATAVLAHRHARQPAGAGPGAHGARAAGGGASGATQDAIELIVIRTTGDAIQDRPLAEVGGKGLFTKEIEEALLDGASTSPCIRPRTCRPFCRTGLMLAACLRARGSARRLHQPQGADRSPTCRKARRSAPRRCAGRRWPSALRPDLRGRAVARQCRDAAAQARRRRGRRDAAGARRPEAARARRSTRPSILSIDEFLPAVGQGAIGIEARADDDAHARHPGARSIIADTSIALACERAFLAVLDGSCRTPIAGHATSTATRCSFAA